MASMSLADRAAWTQLVAEAEPATVIRANKYGAQVTTVDGIRFDSKREARRYLELRLLASMDLIVNLELQPKYPILVVPLANRKQLLVCGYYRADFRYVDAQTGEVIIEDVKTPITRTTAYRLRKKLIETIHSLTIREV